MAASIAIVNAGPTSPVICAIVEMWQLWMRQCGVQLAEARADCLHLQPHRVDGDGRDDQGNEWSGNPSCDPRPDHDNREGGPSDSDRRGCERHPMLDERDPLAEKLRRHGTHLQAKQVLDLARKDDHGDAAREADDHGVWNELDRASELREAHDDEEYARHQRRHRESVDAVLLDNAVDNHHKCAGRPSDLDARPAERRNEEPSHDRGPEAPARRDTTGNGKSDGQRKRDDADDDAGREVPTELRAVVVSER